MSYLKQARELGLAVRNVGTFLLRAVVSEGVHHVAEGEKTLPNEGREKKKHIRTHAHAHENQNCSPKPHS